MLSKDICAQNMTMLAEVYDYELSAVKHKIYYEILKDMSDLDFKQAIRKLLSTRVYPTFPKPAEILALSEHKETVTNYDPLEIEANRLIDLVRGIRDQVFNNALASGRTFEDELEGSVFKNLDESDNAVLNNIKGHYGLKTIIANINVFKNTTDAIRAFKTAILNRDRGEISGPSSFTNKITVKRH